jgi:hypothetical protein
MHRSALVGAHLKADAFDLDDEDRLTLAMKSMNLAARLGDVKWVFAELEKVSELVPEKPSHLRIFLRSDEAIAHMAIALRLITLAFGPVVGRNLHSVHDRAHNPSLGTDDSESSFLQRESASCRPALRRIKIF